MTTEMMITELRRLSQIHKNDRFLTFETNWSNLCSDVADRLEELQAEINANNNQWLNAGM